MTLAVPLDDELAAIVHVVAVHDVMASPVGVPEPSTGAPSGICVVSVKPVSVGEPVVRVTGCVIVLPAM